MKNYLLIIYSILLGVTAVSILIFGTVILNILVNSAVI